MDRGVLAALVEADRKIVIDRPPSQGVVLEFKMAVDEANPIQRLARAGHRVDHAKDEQTEVGRGSLRGLRRLRGFRRRKLDRRSAGVAGGGDRKRAVLAHMKAQVEPVEIRPGAP